MEKGFELPDDPFQMELYPQPDISNMDFDISNKQTNYEHPFDEELKEFEEWGEAGNKENIIKILD